MELKQKGYWLELKPIAKHLTEMQQMVLPPSRDAPVFGKLKHSAMGDHRAKPLCQIWLGDISGQWVGRALYSVPKRTTVRIAIPFWLYPAQMPSNLRLKSCSQHPSIPTSFLF